MPKWRNKIQIKQFFTEEEDNQSVLKVVSKLIPQLQSIIRNEQRYLSRETNDANKKENVEYMLNQLEEVTEEFIWIKDGINNNEDITEIYDSWCEVFNEYLNQLYDIGDSVVKFNNFHDDEKFLWIG